MFFFDPKRSANLHVQFITLVTRDTTVENRICNLLISHCDTIRCLSCLKAGKDCSCQAEPDCIDRKLALAVINNYPQIVGEARLDLIVVHENFHVEIGKVFIVLIEQLGLLCTRFYDLDF